MSPAPNHYYNSDYNSDYDSDEQDLEEWNSSFQVQPEPEAHYMTPDHDCTLTCECDIVNLQEEIDDAHHRIFHLENNTEDLGRTVTTLLMAINYLLHRDSATRSE